MQTLRNFLKSCYSSREPEHEVDLSQNYRLRERQDYDDHVDHYYRKNFQVMTDDEKLAHRNAQYKSSRLELIELSGKIDIFKNDTTLVLEKCIDFPRYPGWQSAVNQIEQFLKQIDIANVKFASQRVPNKFDDYRSR